jgi:hypothetical protein
VETVAKVSDTWGSVAAMVVMIIVGLVVLDRCAALLAPPWQLREAEDGLSELEAGDPETLVVGSSHARTFHALGQEVARRTGRKGEVIAIPLESGKLVSYWWMIQHRILPLIDETNSQGIKARPSLRQFVLLTQWWDSCDFPGNQYWNIPGRAWNLRAYAADAYTNGFNEFNRNFIRYRTVRMMDLSALVSDRIKRRMPGRISEVIGLTSAEDAVARQARILRTRHDVESGTSCLGAADQMQAMESILEVMRDRGLRIRVVLFPLMPATISQQASDTTLEFFREKAEKLAAKYDAEFIDMTLGSPLESEDFMDDFDHLRPKGNLKFANWVLSGDFADLVDGPATNSTGSQ